MSLNKATLKGFEKSKSIQKLFLPDGGLDDVVIGDSTSSKDYSFIIFDNIKPYYDVKAINAALKLNNFFNTARVLRNNKLIELTDVDQKAFSREIFAAYQFDLLAATPDIQNNDTLKSLFSLDNNIYEESIKNALGNLADPEKIKTFRNSLISPASRDDLSQALSSLGVNDDSVLNNIFNKSQNKKILEAGETHYQQLLNTSSNLIVNDFLVNHKDELIKRLNNLSINEVKKHFPVLTIENLALFINTPLPENSIRKLFQPGGLYDKIRINTESPELKRVNINSRLSDIEGDLALTALDNNPANLGLPNNANQAQITTQIKNIARQIYTEIQYDHQYYNAAPEQKNLLQQNEAIIKNYIATINQPEKIRPLFLDKGKGMEIIPLAEAKEKADLKQQADKLQTAKYLQQARLKGEQQYQNIYNDASELLKIELEKNKEAIIGFLGKPMTKAIDFNNLIIKRKIGFDPTTATGINPGIRGINLNQANAIYDAAEKDQGLAKNRVFTTSKTLNKIADDDIQKIFRDTFNNQVALTLADDNEARSFAEAINRDKSVADISDFLNGSHNGIARLRFADELPINKRAAKTREIAKHITAEIQYKRLVGITANNPFLNTDLKTPTKATAIKNYLVNIFAKPEDLFLLFPTEAESLEKFQNNMRNSGLRDDDLTANLFYEGKFRGLLTKYGANTALTGLLNNNKANIIAAISTISTDYPRLDTSASIEEALKKPRLMTDRGLSREAALGIAGAFIVKNEFVEDAGFAPTTNDTLKLITNPEVRRLLREGFHREMRVSLPDQNAINRFNGMFNTGKSIDEILTDLESLKTANHIEFRSDLGDIEKTGFIDETARFIYADVQFKRLRTALTDSPALQKRIGANETLLKDSFKDILTTPQAITDLLLGSVNEDFSAVETAFTNADLSRLARFFFTHRQLNFIAQAQPDLQPLLKNPDLEENLIAGFLNVDPFPEDTADVKAILENPATLRDKFGIIPDVVDEIVNAVSSAPVAASADTNTPTIDYINGQNSGVANLLRANHELAITLANAPDQKRFTDNVLAANKDRTAIKTELASLVTDGFITFKDGIEDADKNQKLDDLSKKIFSEVQYKRVLDQANTGRNVALSTAMQKPENASSLKTHLETLSTVNEAKQFINGKDNLDNTVTSFVEKGLGDDLARQFFYARQLDIIRDKQGALNSKLKAILTDNPNDLKVKITNALTANDDYPQDEKAIMKILRNKNQLLARGMINVEATTISAAFKRYDDSAYLGTDKAKSIADSLHRLNKLMSTHESYTDLNEGLGEEEVDADLNPLQLTTTEPFNKLFDNLTVGHPLYAAMEKLIDESDDDEINQKRYEDFKFLAHQIENYATKFSKAQDAMFFTEEKINKHINEVLQTSDRGIVRMQMGMNSRIGLTDEERKDHIKQCQNQIDRINVLIGRINEGTPEKYKRQIDKLEAKRIQFDNMLKKLQKPEHKKIFTHSAKGSKVVDLTGATLGDKMRDAVNKLGGPFPDNIDDIAHGRVGHEMAKFNKIVETGKFRADPPMTYTLSSATDRDKVDAYNAQYNGGMQNPPAEIDFKLGSGVGVIDDIHMVILNYGDSAKLAFVPDEVLLDYAGAFLNKLERDLQPEDVGKPLVLASVVNDRVKQAIAGYMEKSSDNFRFEKPRLSTEFEKAYLTSDYLKKVDAHINPETKAPGLLRRIFGR